MSNIGIGDLSRATGTPVETIRYYERIGLLRAPTRSTNGRRVYTPDDVALLRFIRQARGLDFSLADVRELISLRDGRTCRPIAAIANRHLSFVRAKIETLQTIEKRLARATEACSNGAPDCSASEILAALVPGPLPVDGSH